MRCTPERAIELLQHWQEEGAWLFTVARFSEGDEHRFWARIRSAAHSEVWLAGESAMVSLRLDSDACQYTELASVPPGLTNHLTGFAGCLTIQSREFSAVLAPLKPEAEEP